VVVGVGKCGGKAGRAGDLDRRERAIVMSTTQRNNIHACLAGPPTRSLSVRDWWMRGVHDGCGYPCPTFIADSMVIRVGLHPGGPEHAL